MLAWVIGLGALHYVTGDPSQFDAVFRDKYTAHRTLVVTHGVCSIIALLVGPFQFLKKRSRWHRQLGYLYLVSLVLGAVTGLPMALMAEGGPMARLGFALTDLLWLATAWLALQSARQRRFGEHRAQMIRSYALTFGAVMLRLFLYGLQHLGYEFNAIYPYTPWLSWLTSLAVAEWILEGETHVHTARLLRKSAPARHPAGAAGPGSLELGHALHASHPNP